MSDPNYMAIYHAPLPRQGRALRMVDRSYRENHKKCLRCGFMIAKGRDKEGEGVGYRTKDRTEPGILTRATGDLKDVRLTIDGRDTVHLPAEGKTDNIPVRHEFYSTIYSGCPMCGSRTHSQHP